MQNRMNKILVKVSRRALYACLPLALVVACGRSDESNTQNTVSSTFSWKDKAASQRITNAEIAQLYTTETVVQNGRTYPFSKTPLKFVYKPETAPAEFLEEWGEFTAGTEVKGYMNLGYVAASGFQERLIKNFESISSWNTIQGADGKPLFADSFEVDDRGNQIEDKVDGKAGAEGDLHKIKLIMNSPAGALPVIGTLTLYNRNGEIQADIVNTEDVRVFPVGVILKKGALNIHLKFYRYQKGWLVYGAAAVELEKFKDAIKPEDLTKTVDSFYGWLKDRTIVAL